MKIFFLSLFMLSGFFLKAQTNPDTETMESHEPCEQPQYPGGMAAMNAFLHANLQYDSTMIYGNTSRVYVEFVVDSTGKIFSPKIKRGTGTPFDSEVLRVFRLMPDWVPMICDNKKQRTKLVIPVRIELK